MDGNLPIVAGDAFAHGGHKPDIALITAWEELRAIRARFNAEELDAAVDALWDRISTLQERILLTPPSSIDGCRVKLRMVADPTLGIDTGVRTDRADTIAIRQVIECLGRLAGGPTL